MSTDRSRMATDPELSCLSIIDGVTKDQRHWHMMTSAMTSSKTAPSVWPCPSCDRALNRMYSTPKIHQGHDGHCGSQESHLSFGKENRWKNGQTEDQLHCSVHSNHTDNSVWPQRTSTELPLVVTPEIRNSHCSTTKISLKEADYQPQSHLDLLSTVCTTPSVQSSSWGHPHWKIIHGDHNYLASNHPSCLYHPRTSTPTQCSPRSILHSETIFLPTMSKTDLLMHAANVVEEQFPTQSTITPLTPHGRRKRGRPYSTTAGQLGYHCKNTQHLPHSPSYSPRIVPTPSQQQPPVVDERRLTKLGTTFTNNTLPHAILSHSHKAALLAEQALLHPVISKKLLLSMALVRSSPRSPPSSYPLRGSTIPKRFHWASYPPLDQVLRDNMKEYYELSRKRCMTKAQLEFNVRLLELVKKKAQEYGWIWEEDTCEDRRLRDRIRCYYKTHIQNAKKRLMTMLKNPQKRANVKALAEHFDIIQGKFLPDHSDGLNIIDHADRLSLMSCDDNEDDTEDLMVDIYGCETDVSFGSDISFDSSFEDHVNDVDESLE